MARSILRHSQDVQVYYAWISTHRNWAADGCTRSEKLEKVLKLLDPIWVKEEDVEAALEEIWAELKEELLMYENLFGVKRKLPKFSA